MRLSGVSASSLGHSLESARGIYGLGQGVSGLGGWTDCLNPWSPACAAYVGANVPVGSVPAATVGTPRPPTQGELEEAERTGDYIGLEQKLSNEQVVSQQAINAGGVQPVFDGYGVTDFPSKLFPGGFDTNMLVMAGLGMIVVLFIVGDESRRLH